MDVEEAIKTAIEFETKVRDVYTEAEQKAENPIGKHVFNILVQEEQSHLDYLENKLEQWEKTGTVTPDDLATAIPSKRNIEIEVNKLKIKLGSSSSEKKYTDIELQMLKKALEVENETSDFYKRMVLELPEKAQELFIRFVEIEEGHKAIVQAEIDSVTCMGYWFDIPEFNLSGA